MHTSQSSPPLESPATCFWTIFTELLKAKAVFVIIIDQNSRFLVEYHLSNVDVSGSHQASPLPPELSDHDGDAVVLVPLPVFPLTLLTTVGDGVTLTALVELLSSSLATSRAYGSITLLFWHCTII